MSEKQERLILETVGATGKVALLFDHDKAGLRCQQEVMGRLMKECFVKMVDTKLQSKHEDIIDQKYSDYI